MIRNLTWATALALGCISSAAIGQPARRPPLDAGPGRIVPDRPAPRDPQAQIRQPSMAELRAAIAALSRQVTALSAQLETMTARGAAQSQQLTALSSAVTSDRRLAQERHRQVVTAAYGACNLLYLHHWVQGSAQHPYRNSDYCSGVISEGVAVVPR